MQAVSKVDSFHSKNLFTTKDIPSADPRAGSAPGTRAYPHARHLGDLISAKQIQIAGAISRSAGIDGNRVAQDLFDCELNELSKLSAEALIGIMEQMAAEMRPCQDLSLTA